MESSTDGDEGEVTEAMLKRHRDAGAVIARLAPHLFAQMVAAAEVTAVALIDSSSGGARNIT